MAADMAAATALSFMMKEVTEYLEQRIRTSPEAAQEDEQDTIIKKRTCD
jgi:hypothetical protein